MITATPITAAWPAPSGPRPTAARAAAFILAAAPAADLILDAVPAELQAAAAGKPPGMRVHAYDSGIIRVAQGPVVIDHRGVETRPAIPLIRDHDAERVIGHSTSVAVGPTGIDARGIFSGAGPDAEEVLTAARNGFPWQASVGLQIGQRRYLRAGEAVTVNGRAFTAPDDGLMVVDTCTLVEISIVAIGADGNTSVSLAAKHATHGGITMTPEEEAAIRTAERERLAKIEAATRGLEAVPAIADLKAKAVAGEITVETLQAEALSTWGKRDELAQIRAARAPIPAVTEHGRQDLATVRAVTEANLLLAMGRPDLVAKLAPAIAERTKRPRHAMDWFVAVLEAEHREIPEGKNALLKAAFSTNLASESFTSANSRIALDAFTAAAPSILKIARVVDLKDFRVTDILRPTLGGQFQPVGLGGELKHGVVDEHLYDSIQADTYGQIFGLDRKDAINDDLGVIPQLIAGIARNGARVINDVGWTVWMSNAGSFFSSDNANYLTTNPLGVDNLTAAIKAFREQTDKNKKPVDIKPAFLVVPPALEMMAATLLKSTTLARDTSTDSKAPTANPLQGLLDLLVEARLGNAKFVGFSSLAWYISASPAEGSIVLGFVNGVSSPVVESVTPPPEHLGLMWRGYIDIAACYGEPRAAFKAKGEA